jgi:uncharacterized protein YjlB
MHGPDMTKPETFILHGKDWVPNNERLPVILYRTVVKAEGTPAAERFEALFANNGWPPQWRDTIFDYHHYHSTTHEALGVYAGAATLMLGGPDGKQVEVAAGDALILPVGTGHCRIDATGDFAVVGGYPAGMAWDVQTKAPGDATWTRMRRVPLPDKDPVSGQPIWTD